MFRNLKLKRTVFISLCNLYDNKIEAIDILNSRERPSILKYICEGIVVDFLNMCIQQIVLQYFLAYC